MGEKLSIDANNADVVRSLALLDKLNRSAPIVGTQGIANFGQNGLCNPHFTRISDLRKEDFRLGMVGAAGVEEGLNECRV